MIDVEEIARIARRHESWEHREPRTFGEVAQMYREYIADMATVLEALKELGVKP